MLEKLGNTIKKVTDKVAGSLFVDKKLIDSIVKDLQRALIEADVDISLVKELSDEIRKKAISEKIKDVEKKEQIIKLIHDKMLEMLGGDKKELEIKKKAVKIMLVGLYGSGKTTTIAKLTNYYSKRGFKTCMLGLDVHRPAAREQLEQLGEKNKLKVFVDKKEQSPVKIYTKFEKELKKYDVVLIDTAGRHSLDKSLVSEIKSINEKIKPEYKFLVLAADIGQAAKNLASEFKKALDINGVIVTRMDSSGKAGGALTACNEVDAGVYFITTGEKINDIETFSSKRFVSRILGMGDLEALIEKVQSSVDKSQEKKLKKRLEEGKFTMDDLYSQLESMSGMGSLGKIAGLIPGFGKAKVPENMLGKQEDRMKKWKYAIQSMTPEEKENPEVLEKQTGRLQRIAKGAGINTSDVRALIKQYKMLKEFMKTGKNMDFESGQGLSQKQLQKLAKKFGRKMKF